MIIYLIGPSGSGKTTLASKFKGATNIDGDVARKVWTDLGFTKEDRTENNLRVARLAKALSEQGHTVVVSTICPYKELRAEIQKICNPVFIQVTHEGAKGRSDDAKFEDLDGLKFNITV